MWLRAWVKSALLLLLLAQAGHAASVAAVSCPPGEPTAECGIQLNGAVSERDLLYISRVYDRDTLLFQKQELGSTGTFFGHPFLAAFLPRLYPLKALRGVHSPHLMLHVEAGLGHLPEIPPNTTVKIVDSSFPLWMLLGPPLAALLVWGFLLGLSLHLVSRPPSSLDGWIYPAEETRWLLGSLSLHLLLRQNLSAALVPSVWSEHWHLTLLRLTFALALWSLTQIFLNGRFSDRSCIEHSKPRAPLPLLRRLSHFTLIACLWLLAQLPQLRSREAAALLFLPFFALLPAWARSLQDMEWKRVLKRSSLAPLVYYSSLLAIPMAALSFQLADFFGRSLDVFFPPFAWLALLSAAWRYRSIGIDEAQSRILARECRHLLLEHPRGGARLSALCRFVSSEWGAARISVISIAGDAGFLLASEGPEAITDASRSQPRRLGPFLRRACKRGHMLYAPQAEELGQELREQGLKHSSLAIPLLQGREVRAVLCMMADEDERIPPGDALQLELLTEVLRLEILSAVDQHELEERNAQLLMIARMANSLAVDHLDQWGLVHRREGTESRVLLGAECVFVEPFAERLQRSPVLGKVWAAHQAELHSLWSSLAAIFEFIPKDSRGHSWWISPREFRHPFLQALGPERVALLLASALERQARSLAARDGYLLLGYCGTRLAAGPARLIFPLDEGSSVELHPEDLASLLTLRQQTPAGTLLFRGTPPLGSGEGSQAFGCRSKPWPASAEQIFSILSVTADKKELRRLEAQALERARLQSRKAA